MSTKSEFYIGFIAMYICIAYIFALYFVIPGFTKYIVFDFNEQRFITKQCSDKYKQILNLYTQ